MNILKAKKFVRNACRFAALFAVLFAPAARGAEAQQPGRFLLVFETSPVLKKNLPALKQNLGVLFSSNLQNEMKAGDDIAVWTVEETLHTGTFPLESWMPDGAEEYATGLNDFLGKQKYSRHASLAALQPLLNRVARNSDRLTVLIFCDGQGGLVGTPYDSGVNDILTNAAARAKGTQSPFILVLRAYHGEYLGCSVNRSGMLNFPAFPPPPAPEAPAPKPAPVVAPVTGPPVTPVQALIIVGTHASTNASDANKILAKPAFTVPAVPATVPRPFPVTTQTLNTPPIAPPPNLPTPPQDPPPIQHPPAQVLSSPAPAPAPQPAATTESPMADAPAGQAATPSPTAPLVSVATATDSAYVWPLVLGGGLLAAAVGIVIWFLTRSKAPPGSLITSSMRDDPRLPPRK